MKKLWLLALWATLILWTLAGCWSNKEVNNTNNVNTNTWSTEESISEKSEVVQYNDKIINLSKKCAESEDLIWTLYDAYSEDNTSFKVEDIQNAINSTIKLCSDNLQEVNNAWDWEWDSSLKDWSVEFLSREIEYYQKFSELLPYLTKWDLTEDEKAIHDSLLTEIQSIEERLWKATKDLTPIQRQFAKKYDFELENDIEENDEWTIDEEPINEEENIPSEEISE
jgi:hypothetical protein